MSPPLGVLAPTTNVIHQFVLDVSTFQYFPSAHFVLSAPEITVHCPELLTYTIDNSINNLIIIIIKYGTMTHPCRYKGASQSRHS